MSERFVLERRKASYQVFDRQSAQIRQLQSRANRGAVRTARQDGFTPADLTAYAAALSLDVLAGRWTVTGEADFVIAAPVVGVSPRLTVAVFDHSSGAQLAGARFEFAERGIDLTTTSAFRWPITVTGDFTSLPEDTAAGDGIVTVSLMAWDALGNTYTLLNPQLQLMPW